MGSRRHRAFYAVHRPDQLNFRLHDVCADVVCFSRQLGCESIALSIRLVYRRLTVADFNRPYDSDGKNPVRAKRRFAAAFDFNHDDYAHRNVYPVFAARPVSGLGAAANRLFRVAVCNAFLLLRFDASYQNDLHPQIRQMVVIQISQWSLWFRVDF